MITPNINYVVIRTTHVDRYAVIWTISLIIRTTHVDRCVVIWTISLIIRTTHVDRCRLIFLKCSFVTSKKQAHLV